MNQMDFWSARLDTVALLCNDAFPNVLVRYLGVLSDGALQLHLSMDGDRVVKRAGTRASDGGFRDRSLSQLSGGQWRRTSLALELAFAELARQRSRFSCNVLVLDEVLSQLDSYGRARVRGC